MAVWKNVGEVMMTALDDQSWIDILSWESKYFDVYECPGCEAEHLENCSRKGYIGWLSDKTKAIILNRKFN
jgi:hypothetical protein